MLKEVGELGVANKISLTTIGISIGNSFSAWVGWFSENLVQMSAAATFILTIVMIFSYILGEIRKNRSSSIETRKSELEIERQKLEVRKLQHELKQLGKSQKKNNPN
jgi:hypothetical protein